VRAARAPVLGLRRSLHWDASASLTVGFAVLWAERLAKFAEATEQDFEGLGEDRCFSALLDCDLRKFAEGGVPEGLGKSDRTMWEGPVVVQVLKVANITEPSYNQHAQGGRGRVLMIALTDGKRECTALEYSPVQGLTLDTPPGTKVRVANASVVSGVVLLDSQCCSVVGGVVKAMKEDWETQRRYSNAARRMMIKESRTGGSNTEGEDDEPPPKFTMLAGAVRQPASDKHAQSPKPGSDKPSGPEKQATAAATKPVKEQPTHQQKRPPAQQQQQQQQAAPCHDGAEVLLATTGQRRGAPPRRGRGVFDVSNLPSPPLRHPRVTPRQNPAPYLDSARPNSTHSILALCPFPSCSASSNAL
jgi:hypothetical protein